LEFEKARPSKPFKKPFTLLIPFHLFQTHFTPMKSARLQKVDEKIFFLESTMARTPFYSIEEREQMQITHLYQKLVAQRARASAMATLQTRVGRLRF
jgi:hypothetical protein